MEITNNQKVNELLADFLSKEAEKDSSFEKLRIAAIDACPYKVGDKVRFGKKIGRVTKVKVEVAKWFSDKPTVEVIPFALPIKKDGSTASIGEMRLWYGEDGEILERAEMPSA